MWASARITALLMVLEGKGRSKSGGWQPGYRPASSISCRWKLLLVSWSNRCAPCSRLSKCTTTSRSEQSASDDGLLATPRLLPPAALALSPGSRVSSGPKCSARRKTSGTPARAQHPPTPHQSALSALLLCADGRPAPALARRGAAGRVRRRAPSPKIATKSLAAATDRPSARTPPDTAATTTTTPRKIPTTPQAHTPRHPQKNDDGPRPKIDRAALGARARGEAAEAGCQWRRRPPTDGQILEGAFVRILELVQEVAHVGEVRPANKQRWPPGQSSRPSAAPARLEPATRSTRPAVSARASAGAGLRTGGGARPGRGTPPRRSRRNARYDSRSARRCLLRSETRDTWKWSARRGWRGSGRRPCVSLSLSSALSRGCSSRASRCRQPRLLTIGTPFSEKPAKRAAPASAPPSSSNKPRTRRRRQSHLSGLRGSGTPRHSPASAPTRSSAAARAGLVPESGQGPSTRSRDEAQWPPGVLSRSSSRPLVACSSRGSAKTHVCRSGRLRGRLVGHVPHSLRGNRKSGKVRPDTHTAPTASATMRRAAGAGARRWWAVTRLRG
eukprot:scaffold1793_cov399-Prasinococcus_capsulatus_cf.AAC.3